MILDLDLAIESIYRSFCFYTLNGVRMKNKLGCPSAIAHPWPLRLAKELFHAGALVTRAEFVRCTEQQGLGYIQFHTRWGDAGLLVSAAKEARMLTLLNAKTLIARNLPGVELTV